MTRREEISKIMIDKYRSLYGSDSFLSVYITDIDQQLIRDMKQHKKIDSVTQLNCDRIFNFLHEASTGNKKTIYGVKTGLFDIEFKGRHLLYAKYLFSIGGREEIRTNIVGKKEDLDEFFRLQKITRRKTSKPKPGIYNVYSVPSPYGSYTQYENIEKTLPKTSIIHNIKDDILTHIDMYFKNKEKFMLHGRPGRKCILLYGPPGTGKSSITYEISYEHKEKCIVYASDIVALMDHVQVCEKYNMPTIIFYEDCEESFFRNDKGIKNFLSGIDAKQNLGGCYIVFTTNYPKAIEDTIIKRKGRIDRLFHVGKLNGEQLENVAELYFSNSDVSNMSEIKSLFSDCKFSGSEVEAIWQESLTHAASMGEDVITPEIVKDCIETLGGEFTDMEKMSEEDIEWNSNSVRSRSTVRGFNKH